jgi:hypothetical protein
MTTSQDYKSLEAELFEQCRLLGKSGEREAKHLSMIETLKRENLKLSNEVDMLKSKFNSLIDLNKNLEEK